MFKPPNYKPDINKIAITGKIGAGKDIVGRYLVEAFGYTRYAFGDNIRHYAKEIFKRDPAPRSLLQWFGETMRQYDTHVWVNLLLKDVEEGGRDKIVITDLRQPHEVEMLQNRKYTFLRINTTKENRIKRIKLRGDIYKQIDLNHTTESYVELIPVHYDIYNNGTLIDTFRQVRRIIEGD